MDTRDIYKLVREFEEEKDDVINLYDSLDIELSEDFVIETGIVGFTEDGVIIHLDEDAMEFLDFNGVLLESEDQINESEDDNSSDAVRNAVTNRIMRQHPEVLAKFGPEAVMAAVDDIAYYLDDLEEIGSSDVSIWTKQAIEDLEAGHYKHLHEGDGFGNVDAFKAKLARSSDPFEMIYDAISGDYGEEIRDAFQEMYDDVVNDSGYRLHPDDDFEKIIEIMVDQLVPDSDDYKLDELAEIKRLAGQEQVDEGWKEKAKAAALGAALVGASTQVNWTTQSKIDQIEKIADKEGDWQTGTLIDMRKEAMKAGDEARVKRLERRIFDTYEHNFYNLPNDSEHRIPGEINFVRGEDGEPIDPRNKPDLEEAVGDYTVKNISPADSWKKHTEPKKSKSEVPVDPKTGKTLYQKVQGLEEDDLDEAEYQGRKVPLGKPMQGDVKKSKVYVKKPNGKVVKVNFGDKNMKIKKSNPARRKSFRARHNCDNPGPRWKARYWSCRAW